MNAETIREYCIAKNGTTESFPFNEDVLVFKVGGKVYALLDLSEPDSINLKCEPEYAIELREKFEEIFPGYHMNKKHWNTVMINGSLSKKLILDLIDHSYEKVVKGLGKKGLIFLKGQKNQL